MDAGGSIGDDSEHRARMPIVYSRKRLRAPKPAPPPAPPPPAPPPSPPPPPPPQPAPASPKRKRKRYTQLYLDAGQKDLIKTCGECGMLYTPGKDDGLHRRYHASPLRWSARTRAAPLSEHLDMRLYGLHARSYGTVERIDRYVSAVLGTALALPAGGWLAVVAVRGGGVVGFCLAERIRCARVLDYGGVLVGGERVKADMGVRKIWVEERVRGRGVAARLVDEARLHLVYGHVVEKRFVAFSVPTRDGTAFAKRYCADRVLVYDTDVQDKVDS